MKKTTILLNMLCFLIAFSGFSQTIRRVNNNPSASGLNVYQNAQAAHDAASNGDIIYIEPAFWNGNGDFVTCTKQLTFIGNGFRIPDNLTSNSPADTRTATSSLSINFNIGSAGSKVTGLSLGFCEIKVPNVTVDRCLITGQMRLSYTPSAIYPFYAITVGDNFTITNCFIQYNGGNGGANIGAISSIPISSGVNRNPTGVTVSNNIADTFISLVGGISASTVSYNTITSELGYANTTTFSNNIVYYPTTPGTGPNNQPSSYPSCTFTNNICNHPTTVYFPTGGSNTGNQNQVSTTNFFQGSIYLGGQGTNKESWYQLHPSSPALTAGVGGTQIGAFGGSLPYRLSGIPAVPIITNFTNSGVGNSTTPLSVSVTVRGNN